MSSATAPALLHADPAPRSWRAAPASLGRYVFSPGDYFTRLRENPQWLAAFVLSAAGAMLVAWGMLPFVTRGLETALPSGIPADRLAVMRNQLLFGQHLGVIFGPVLLLLKSAICAVLLIMLSQVIAGRGTFREGMTLIAHVLPFGVLKALHTLLALKLRGVDSIHGPMDVQISLGLNLIWRNVSPAMDALLQNVSLYEVLAFCYLAIGLRALFQCRRSAAFSIAGLYWAIGTAVAIAMTVITEDLKGGM